MPILFKPLKSIAIEKQTAVQICVLNELLPCLKAELKPVACATSSGISIAY